MSNRNRLNSDNCSGWSVDKMIWYLGGARLITNQQVVLLRVRHTRNSNASELSTTTMTLSLIPPGVDSNWYLKVGD